MLPEMFDLNTLVSDWKNGQYKESSTYKYIIVLILVQTIRITPTSATKEQSGWIVFFVSIVIAMIIVWLFRILWEANGGEQGQRFLEKWASITAVLSVTRAIPLSLVIAALVYLPILLTLTSIAVGAALVGLASVWIMIGWLYMKTLNLIKEIRAVENRNPATDGFI